RRSGKTLLADALATSFERPRYCIELDRLEDDEDARELLELALDNARALGALLHVARPELLGERATALRATLAGALVAHPGLALLETWEVKGVPAGLDPHLQFIVDLGRPDVEARVQLW